MENLNEGKKPNYMAELAEIDKQSALVAMETKISALEEMAKAKEARLEMVNEDENLSELISKSAVKEMRKDIKEINKAKLKLEKLYEKASGNKPSKVIDEDMSELPDEIAAREKDAIERDARKMEEMVAPTMDDLDQMFGSGDTVERDPATGNPIEKDDVEETYRTYEEDEDGVKEDMNELPDEIAAREKDAIERDARRLEESNKEEINRFRKLAGLKIRN